MVLAFSFLIHLLIFTNAFYFQRYDKSAVFFFPLKF